MLRKTFMGLVAAGIVSLLAVQQANAGWHHRHGSSGGSWGSWGSSGSSGGYYWGSCGSSGGSWGSCGSSGGSWGSSGSSGGYYWGSSGSSGGSSSSCGSSGGYYHHHHPHHNNYPNPPQPPAPGNAPAPQPPAPSTPAEGASTGYHPTYGPMRNSAALTVKVPADAKVFVNDRETTSTGSDRQFISRDLENGARYNYVVRAEFNRDGKPVSEIKTVQLTAGQTAGLDFVGEASVQTAAAEPRTTLIVHVPDDAKLFLAGHETRSTGPVREFSTNRLASGSEWNTYAIRAVVERDGRQEVREETVSLKAGESREVTISFDALASEARPVETASR